MIWLVLSLSGRLGACPVDSSAFWTPPEHWDADDVALEMSDAPDMWTGGSWRGLLCDWWV